MTESPPLTSAEIVCLGARKTVKGNVGYLFVSMLRLASALDRGSTLAIVDDAAQLYQGKHSSGYAVGGVYRADVRLGDGNRLDSINFSTFKFDRRLNNDFVAEAELKQMAVLGEQRVAAQERKIKANPRVMGEIDFLRGVRRRMGASTRPSFDAAILKLLKEGM